jgi:pimeloyl-ACP methyl ester carboxylesterase
MGTKDQPIERVEAWQRAGRPEEFRGHSIHVHRRSGSDPLLVLLHGFPSSSYDFRHLIPLLGDHALLAFDFLGFGLSDKPRRHRYSLFWQADLCQELVRRHFPGRPVFLAAHDMGTSVATELMARDLDETLDLELADVLLFNGSIVLERASPTPAQRLLRSPLGPVAARLSSYRVFRHQFGSVFSAAHPLGDEEAADQWSLICLGGGRTLGHKLISYERERYASRWHGAVRDWPGALSLAWGMRDPVATPAVLAALRDLRPGVPVSEFPELGHYPQLEHPEALARAIADALN